MSYFGHRWNGRFAWQLQLARSLCAAGVIVVLAAGGSSAQRPSPTQEIDNRPAVSQATGVAAGVPTIYDAQRLVGEYIRDGRYDEDVAKVVGQARAWLEERAKTAMKPAIVLDIDETSLSNWPAYRVNGWVRIVNGACDLQQGPCGLRAWQALGQSKAIAPTLSLARRARELSVAVFFITGRPSSLREATERNLRDQGYEWTAVILQPEGAQFASAADFKAPERRKLTDQGYTIVLSLGDQDSDLIGGYAEKTFKLPNPVYYLP
jgi:pimeloyl-ACP methyl ester carboxylesterase